MPTLLTRDSDTTSTTLSHLWFHLASDQDLVKKLQEEIDAVEKLNDDTISKIELLDATIYETLRLHPAVPSGLQRITPPEGISIGEKYIPGNTIVQMPFHKLFRGETLFALSPYQALIQIY
jgi:cytochrome P450